MTRGRLLADLSGAVLLGLVAGALMGLAVVVLRAPIVAVAIGGVALVAYAAHLLGEHLEALWRTRDQQVSSAGPVVGRFSVGAVPPDEVAAPTSVPTPLPRRLPCLGHHYLGGRYSCGGECRR